jgi:hypothetical protein
MISLIDITYACIMPLFCSTPTSLGGLGFSPAAIGIFFSIYGVLNGLFQVFCFAAVTNRYGAKRVLVVCVITGFPIIALFPLMSIWTKHYGYVTPAVYAMILLQTALFIVYSMSFGIFL